MKNKIISISLIISILLISILFVLTGCGSKIATNDNILEYLNKEYPGDSFTIISKEKVNSIPIRGNGSGSHEGYKYIVQSNETNIEFIVEDIYEYNSYGTGDYILDDNYKRISIISYIESFGDSRIEITDKELSDNPDYFISTSNIKLNFDNFDSVESIAQVLYNFKTFYENKQPFKNDTDISVWAYIYEKGKSKGHIELSASANKLSEENIIKEVNNKLNTK